MTDDEEGDMQIRKINGRTHDVGLAFTVVTTFNPIKYTDEPYRKPLEKGFLAINKAMNKKHITMDTFFSATVAEHTTTEQTVSTAQVQTEDSIKTEMSHHQLDGDPDDIYDQVYEHSESLSSDGTAITTQDVEDVAEGYGLPVKIAQDIANLVTNKQAGTGNKRGRTDAPPTSDQLSEHLEYRSAKRRKPLDS
jgi:hypothetical protein